MDRRQARRYILERVQTMEQHRDLLAVAASEIDAAGDPILSGELRSRLDKLTDWLDAMYAWGGNI